jgi:hypothetical protein
MGPPLPRRYGSPLLSAHTAHTQAGRSAGQMRLSSAERRNFLGLSSLPRAFRALDRLSRSIPVQDAVGQQLVPATTNLGETLLFWLPLTAYVVKHLASLFKGQAFVFRELQ